MSKMKFTPGPWEIREVAHEATPFRERRVYRVEIIAPQYLYGKRQYSRQICQIVDYCSWTDHPGNARLIEHAPDLYAALEDMLWPVFPVCQKGLMERCVCEQCREDRARAALAKAQGEQ
jgi:hypothetical protein